MRKIYNKIGKIGLMLGMVASVTSCTKNFEEINTNPNQPDNPDASLRLATLEVYAFGEPRFVTWRGNVIFASQFSNQIVYNFKEQAWFPGKTYLNDPGWIDAVWVSSYVKVGSNLHTLLAHLNESGTEADKAIVRIIGSWFYQKMSDMYGDIPYSEVFRPTEEIVIKPKYDKQGELYKAIIEDLGEQISILKDGDVTISGAGDFLYGSAKSKWISFANTLRLRMALRARDAFIADGDKGFVDGVINDALSGDLIDGAGNEAIFMRAQSGLFASDPNELMGGQEDIWHTFAFNQAQWVMNEHVVSLLRDNNDPRLTKMCTKPDSSATFKGTEPNLNTDNIESWYTLSKPTAALRGTSSSSPVPAHIITSSEAYFLKAEAALLGYSGAGDAEEMYQMAIKEHMRLYEVSETDANNFIDNEPMAKLSGSTEDNLKKIWWQRWLSHFNNGYEAWAVARRTDIIPNQDMSSGKYLPNDSDGKVPSKIPYPSSEQTLNSVNVKEAISRLSSGNSLTSKIWWDKK